MKDLLPFLKCWQLTVCEAAVKKCDRPLETDRGTVDTEGLATTKVVD